MLTEIRNRATGWIAWFIVILITIPFALWGVNEYFAGASNINVAVVNGEEINQQTYRYALEQRRSTLTRMLGGNVDPEMINSPEFKRGVLDALVGEVLLSIDADSQGYRISDEQLSTFIQTAPQFKRDGKFAPDLYESAVRTQGYGLADFEQRLRQQSMIDQIRVGFSDSALVTDFALNNLLRLALQRRDFAYATINPEQFVERIQVSDEAIEKRYQEHAEHYQEPEKVKVQFVQLAVADISENVSPDEAQLRQAYDDNRDRYRTPERRSVSHILIKVPSDADQSTQDAALEKAKTLADQARAGEDFAALARQHSEDPGSASKGGDLGVMAKGVMVKPFEDAVYRMREDEISDPIKTRFGYHIIKLTELVPESVQSFEEARAQIEREQRKRLAEGQFIEQAETFRNLVYEQPESLEPVAEELGLSTQTTDWFSRDDGTGIAENARVRDAAFSDDVFIEGLNSETIELDVNTLVALRKLAVEPSKQKPLDDVRATIIEELKREQAQKKVIEMAESLLATLKQGGDWDSVLAEKELKYEEVSRTRLDQQTTPNPQLVEAVFQARRPQAGQPVYGGGVGASGDYTLFRLTNVEDGNPEKAEPEIKERYKALLARRNGYDYFLSYQNGLRTGAEITIYDDQL